MPPQPFDLLIGSVGYESRSRFIPAVVYELGVPLAMFAFASNHVFSFNTNLAFSQSRAAVLEETDDTATFRALVESAVAAAVRENEQVRIGVDVSSMTRTRIAATIEALEYVAQASGLVRCAFYYAPGRYQKLETAGEALIETVEPVARGFAGWDPRVDAPTVAVFGLGYEHERAVGVSEYLDAQDAWAFVPIGEEPEYEQDVRERNALLWDLLGESRFIEYELHDPADTVRRLHGLVNRLKPFSRVVLVPSGPKLFALLCLLTARRFGGEIAVWRATPGNQPPPSDVSPSGRVYGLDATVDELGNWELEDHRWALEGNETQEAISRALAEPARS